MFRPNRIGTPLIHTSDFVASTDSINFAESPNNSTGFVGNVINAAPQLDFGENNLIWTGTDAITAGYRLMLGQQFTVTEPVVGDVVGVELNGSLVTYAPRSALLVPFIMKLAAAGASVLAPVTSADQPTLFRQGDYDASATSAIAIRNIQYREQCIIRGAGGSKPSGTYMHGVMIYGDVSDGYSLTFIQAAMSVRQLNDQQNVGYRDTLR